MHPGFRLTGIETHPLREQLNDEFHSRAPIPLTCPMLVSHLAFHHDNVFSPQEERENVLRLCQTSTCTFIENSPTHLVFDAGSFKMRWELHTEYSSYTFLRPLREGEPLQPDETALDTVFPDWVPIWGGQEFVFFRPIFNLADSAICVGVFLLLIFYRHTLSASLSKEEK